MSIVIIRHLFAIILNKAINYDIYFMFRLSNQKVIVTNQLTYTQAQPMNTTNVTTTILAASKMKTQLQNS